MIMYSTITEEEYASLQRDGVLECKPELAKQPLENEEFAIAYKFMADKLRELYPSDLVYPRWAFTLYEGKDVSLQKDVFFASSPNKKEYRLKLDIKEFLLSDFDAWHVCLNLWPMAYSEEEDDQFSYWMDVAGLSNRDVFLKEHPYANNLREKVIKTWNRIFDIEAQNSYALCRDKTIQAVFWRIQTKDVLEVKEILVDDETYRKYFEF